MGPLSELAEAPRRWRNRWRNRDRGATLVEYSLITALVLVGSLGAIELLTERGQEETDRQVDCVAERPPRASCQIPAIVTTTTAMPPSTPTSAPEPPPLPTEASVSDVTTEDLGDGNWSATVTFTVAEVDSDDIPGPPYDGAVVNVAWQVPGFPPVAGSCTTNSDGECSVTFVPTELSPTAGTVTIRVTNVISDPPVETLPPNETISAP
jgi:hypothetical protein